MSYQKVNYTCILCGFDFKNNISHLRKHFMRKNKCNCINFYFDYEFLLELLDNNTYNEYCDNLIKKKQVQCQFCFKFSHSNNLKRHLKTCKKNPNNNKNTTNNTYNNTTNNFTNNFNINNNIIINPFGNETYDIDYLTNLLDIEPNYSNFFGNKFNFNQRIDNIQKNYDFILKHIYNQPSNINFKMVPNDSYIDKISYNNNKTISHKKPSNKIISNNNNNNNIIKILINDDNIKMKKFNDFVNDVFNNIHNIFLNIINNYEKNNNIKIHHYDEFIHKLLERKNNFINKYNNAKNDVERNNIKNSLFIYYDGFNKLFKNFSDNIILKFYELSHNNSF